MKKLLLTAALAFTLVCVTHAKNTTTRTTQVDGAVTLSEDVDYIITSGTPFAITGRINITNTEHAVIILENVRPSKALSYLSFITINGQPAVNDENCQVKMYAHGSIIMPYSSDIKPLTVYSEQNFGGIAVNDFGLENTGGYMNTLTTAKLNNQIRSFKLKRGYMVTFALRAGGRGYSRCFIADDADLEFATLPEILDKRISSYRIFKWYDAEKKGLANNTSYEATQALNVSWCYSFGLGENRGIDCECVPHHIYEDWPSSSACGSVTYSPHMKTNNEPGNSADDNPQSVETILNNWENLMATGMRLCSPSSHDGSLNHLWEFMDSIDARGWRCDILDIHSYWDTGSFWQLGGWYDRYKRPIWISEWVWGASWNNNGAFASNRRNDQATYDGTVPIIGYLNGWDYVERYAYWNSEQWYTQIYRDGQLTKLGEYYASTNSGMGYKKAYEYVPKFVYKSPCDLTLTYTERLKTLELTWNNPNGEVTDSSFLELRIGDGAWNVVEKHDASEQTSFTYTKVFEGDYEMGLYTYRIHNYDADGTERYSNEQSVTFSGTTGDPNFQYGHMTLSSTEETTGNFTQPESGIPIVLVGLPTYNNTKTALVNNLKSVVTGKYTFRYFPWIYGSYTEQMTENESTDVMVIAKGEQQIGDITIKAADAGRIGRDSTWVSFETPFPEGVTPVVIANVVTTSTLHPYMVKVWNITNEGFAVRLSRQAQEDENRPSFATQKVSYAAATPGRASMGDGKLLTVGRSSNYKIGGITAVLMPFTNESGEVMSFLNPYVLCGPQTDNYDCASIFRINSKRIYEEEAEVNGETVTLTKGLYILRQKDDTNANAPTDNRTKNGDVMGWFVVSDTTEPGTGINETETEKVFISVTDGQIIVDGNDNYQIYTLGGVQMPHDTRLPKGMYIVKSGAKTVKILIP